MCQTTFVYVCLVIDGVLRKIQPHLNEGSTFPHRMEEIRREQSVEWNAVPVDEVPVKRTVHVDQCMVVLSLQHHLLTTIQPLCVCPVLPQTASEWPLQEPGAAMAYPTFVKL